MAHGASLLADRLPATPLLLHGVDVLLPFDVRELAAERAPLLVAVARQGAGRGRGEHRAAGLLRVGAAPEAARRREFLDVGERGREAVRGVPRQELSHPGRVDDAAA